MELKGPLGLSNDCFEPDLTYPLNFMLDTSAINKLVESADDYKLVAMAKDKLGYMYFRTLIEDREIIGMKADGTFHKNYAKLQSKALKMQQIIRDLPIVRVPHMANLMRNSWILDGTCHVLEVDGKIKEVFDKVFNKNPDNYEDAVIIESAIRFNCVTVSNDKAMCENTNKVFPGRAMWYKKFIEGIIKSTQNIK